MRERLNRLLTDTTPVDTSKASTKMRQLPLVVFAAVIVAAAGLFEDQAFKFDWRKNLVGLPVSARLLDSCIDKSFSLNLGPDLRTRAGFRTQRFYPPLAKFGVVSSKLIFQILGDSEGRRRNRQNRRNRQQRWRRGLSRR